MARLPIPESHYEMNFDLRSNPDLHACDWVPFARPRFFPVFQQMLGEKFKPYRPLPQMYFEFDTEEEAVLFKLKYL